MATSQLSNHCKMLFSCGAVVFLHWRNHITTKELTQPPRKSYDTLLFCFIVKLSDKVETKCRVFIEQPIYLRGANKFGRAPNNLQQLVISPTNPSNFNMP